MAAFATLLAFSGCVADYPDIDVSGFTKITTIDPEAISVIEKLGFSADGTVDKGDYYLVEGDIMIPKDIIGEYADSLNTRAGYYSYGAGSRLKNPYISYVRVAVASTDNNIALTPVTQRFHNIVKKAIDEWNSVPGTKLRFEYMFSDQYGYDILVQKSGESEMGYIDRTRSEIPTSDGKPGRSIKINSYNSYGGFSDKLWLSQIIHAMGHAVGFAHRVDPQGSSEEIPNVDGYEPESFMYLGADGSFWEWWGFNEKDKLAIKTLYPLVPAPALNLAVDGPAKEEINREVTFKIMNGSVLLSTNDYAIQWYAGLGTVSGGSTNNTLKVKYSSVGTKMLSVSVVHKASNHKYADVNHTIEILAVPKLEPGIIAPSTQTISSGSRPALLTSQKGASGGVGQLSYQWQSCLVGNAGGNWIWKDIPNAKSLTYQPPVLTESTYYRRRVTDSRYNDQLLGDNVAISYSNHVLVTVSAPPYVILPVGEMRVGGKYLVRIGNPQIRSDYYTWNHGRWQSDTQFDLYVGRIPWLSRNVNYKESTGTNAQIYWEPLEEGMFSLVITNPYNGTSVRSERFYVYP